MGGCTYHLNRRDQIVAVDEGWRRSAEKSGESSLLPASILRRSLWEFISDPRTRLLQGALLRKVRRTRTPIVLGFRCDSPDERRWMEMKISSSAGGEIDVTTSMIRSEPRTHVAVLASAAGEAATEVLRICGWCNRVQVGESAWQEVEELLSARPGWPPSDDSVELQHQLCPDCDRKLVEAGS